MLVLIFINRETGEVAYAVNEVGLVRYVTPSEVGFTDKDGHIRAASFPHSEKLEVNRMGP